MKPFTTVASFIFTTVAVAHVVRLCLHLEIAIGGWMIPRWVSVPGVLVPATLAIMLWREARR